MSLEHLDSQQLQQLEGRLFEEFTDLDQLIAAKHRQLRQIEAVLTAIVTERQTRENRSEPIGRPLQVVDVARAVSPPVYVDERLSAPEDSSTSQEDDVFRSGPFEIRRDESGAIDTVTCNLGQHLLVVERNSETTASWGIREKTVPRSAPPTYLEKEVDLCPPPYTGHGYYPFGPRKDNTMSPLNAEVLKVAKEFITFLNKAVTPFHAVQECKALLTAAGFTELPEHGTWRVEQNKRYFITKNRTAIVAFAVGGQFTPGNGFSIVVGHTDSPGLRVKPISKQSRSNFNQVGVSTYGGGLWRTWFDRDLNIAGEVVYKKKDGELARKLVNVQQPVLFIPNLAIHLETAEARVSFNCNTEENVRPILESQAAALLVGDVNKDGKELGPDGKPIVEPDTHEPTDCSAEHHIHFLKMIAKAAGLDREDIVDLDLFLYDSNPASVVGLHSEFISGARLDNLVGTYTAIQGLINSLSDGSLEKDGHIRMAACYDNEEVGSQSMMGAESGFTEHLLRRLSSGGDQCAFETAIARSMLISADQAHACHPNYAQKHEENHRPKFHGGVVVKINHQQRYATTSTTHSVLKQIALEAQVPLQKVVVRNDSPCGTTVGPILASKLGLAVVDVGCPQLAMHSCREFGDTSSLLQAISLYQQFHRRLPSVFSPLL